MMLKGALSKEGVNLEQLRGLGHHLPKIWETFKVQAGDPSLIKFDGAVSALHAFADLRYPDKIVKSGATILLSIQKLPSAIVAWEGKEPEYNLYLQDIDELFGVIFASTGFNPKVFGGVMLSDEAKTILMRGNLCSALDPNQ